MTNLQKFKEHLSMARNHGWKVKAIISCIKDKKCPFCCSRCPITGGDFAKRSMCLEKCLIFPDRFDHSGNVFTIWRMQTTWYDKEIWNPGGRKIILETVREFYEPKS